MSKSDIAKNQLQIKKKVVSDLQELATEIVPESRHKKVSRELIVIPESFIDDIEDPSGEGLRLDLQLSALAYLEEAGAIENYDQDTKMVLNKISGMKPIPEELRVVTVNFVPKTFLEFLRKVKFEKVHIFFNKDTGEFKVGQTSTFLKIDSMEYRLVKFLYENPNKMHSYITLGKELKLIDQSDRFYRSPIAYQEAGIDRRVDPKLTIIKRKINDKIDEIKGKVRIKGEQNIFICRGGYMIIL